MWPFSIGYTRPVQASIIGIFPSPFPLSTSLRRAPAAGTWWNIAAASLQVQWHRGGSFHIGHQVYLLCNGTRPRYGGGKSRQHGDNVWNVHFHVAPTDQSQFLFHFQICTGEMTTASLLDATGQGKQTSALRLWQNHKPLQVLQVLQVPWGIAAL